MECKTVAGQASLTAGLGATRMVAIFSRQADRFAHRIDIGDSDGSLDIHRGWHSVEGNDEQNWPPSPPFQEAMTQPQAILLVGMAGHAHWSGSVEAVEGPDGSRLVFDIACRTTTPPEQLGSCYRIDSDNSLEVEPLAIDGQVSCRLTEKAGQLAIEPIGVEGPFPGTVRWKYQIRPAVR